MARFKKLLFTVIPFFSSFILLRGVLQKLWYLLLKPLFCRFLFRLQHCFLLPLLLLFALHSFFGSCVFSFLSSSEILFALISSEREAQGRFPKISSTSSAKITSLSISNCDSLACPSLCSESIFFCTFVLFVHHILHFFVNQFSSFFAVRTIERIFIVTVITEVGQLFTHSEVGNHAESLFRNTFQVIHGTGRNTSQEQILSGTSTQCGAHLIKHLFFGGNLAFFGQIPGSAQCTSAWNNRYFNQRIGIFQ